MNYTEEIIRKVFENNKIPFPADDFISALKDEKKLVDKRQEEKEEIRKLTLTVHNIYPATDMKIKQFLKQEVANLSDGYRDLFYDEDGMDDSGEDTEDYFKVGGKIYEVKLHCEANWVGDWSVRKNLPGEITMISFKELTDYTVKYDRGDYIEIILKQ